MFSNIIKQLVYFAQKSLEMKKLFAQNKSLLENYDI